MSSSRGSGTAERESVVPPPASGDRITVALIPKAGADLQHLLDRTGLSKTDIVNRAITLYEFIDSQLRGGRDLLLRDQGTGEMRTVLIV